PGRPAASRASRRAARRSRSRLLPIVAGDDPRVAGIDADGDRRADRGEGGVVGACARAQTGATLELDLDDVVGAEVVHARAAAVEAARAAARVAAELHPPGTDHPLADRAADLLAPEVGVADEAGHEGGERTLVDLRRRSDLQEASRPHHADAI